MLHNLITRLNNKYTTILFLLILFMFGFHPYQLLKERIGEGDDSAYLSHALTIALDFDLNYENEPAGADLNCHHTPVGPIGPGLMAAPFVAFFSIFDRLSGHPIINNHLDHIGSWSLFGFLFSTIFYFWCSLFLYFAAAKKCISQITAGHIFFLIISSGILYYVLGRFTMGHAFEFFTLSLIFWGAIHLWRYSDEAKPTNPGDRKKLISLITIGTGVALTIAVRPANINVVLLPHLLLFLIMFFQSGAKKISWRDHLFLIISIIVAYLPVAFLYYRLYGGFFEGSYDINNHANIPDVNSMNSFYSSLMMLLNLIPNVIPLLFSSEFGLLYSNPLLVFGLGALSYFLIKKLRREPKKVVLIIILISAFVGLPMAIVLFWKTTASSYGYRYLFSIFPLAFLGYLLWYQRFDQVKEKKYFKAVHVVFLALCLFSVLGQLFYASSEKLKPRLQINVFGVNHIYSAKGFNTALLNSVVTPKAWIVLSSQRLPGYVGVKSLGLLSINIHEVGPKIGLKNSFLEDKKEFIERFQRASPQISVQIIILFIIWLLSGLSFFSLISLPSFTKLHAIISPQSPSNSY